MAQLRKDPVTGRWVIVEVEKPLASDAYGVQPHPRSSKICPFCPGNEPMTPAEISAYGRKGGQKNASGWQIRVIPNKFPALRIEETTEKFAFGLYDKIGGFGAHEVIIDHPDHSTDIADMPREHLESLLRVYRDRFADLRGDPRIKYILIFKNHGAAAGASLEHPHSQLIGLPIVPSRVMGEIKGALRHYEHTDRCIYCDMLNQERVEKKFTVFETGAFAAFTPFASRFPFEAWVLPKYHDAVFDTISDEKASELALTLKEVLGRMKSVLKDPPFNFMIHTLPIHGKEFDSYHWHIEIIPNLTRTAGFEWGTGFYVNPTPPEMASRILRG